MSASLILTIIALVCFFFAAVPIPWQQPMQLGWLGMFFLTLASVIKM